MGLYRTTWRNKWLTASAQSIPDMVRLLREAADELEAMDAAGTQLEAGSAVADDHAELVTENPDVAAKFGFQEETDEAFDNEEGDDV